MKLLLTFLTACFLMSCGSSKTSATPEQIAKLDQLVREKSFEIESDWASPMATNALLSLQNAGFFPPGSSASNVSLIGNSNYFRIKGDSISAELPYFGEVQMSSGHYGGDASITLEGTIEDYKVNKNEKKNSYTMTFRARSKNEGYSVFLTLFPSGRTSLRLNGDKRFSIEYTGDVMALDPEVSMTH
ncbi:DUF4251 domain-containing protein [Sediminibacter sp. Hel_I_10]|uniref:DUF4251 domain-containing protein n=1 Tax=Sediminibacter sp. Hel_I_10 TaxID=1392490 RepID=UPI0018CBF7B7|nr:DUF4251 domain-containing protein [Sediminibacter sp. Hel_I_10]